MVLRLPPWQTSPNSILKYLAFGYLAFGYLAFLNLTHLLIYPTQKRDYYPALLILSFN
jgi:hypothetical protein